MAPSIIDLTRDESTTVANIHTRPSGFTKYPELRSALTLIQSATLLKVVESLCESSEDMAKLMHERLILPDSTGPPVQQKSLKRTASQALLGGVPFIHQNKRPRYRFLRCVRCNVDFNVEYNEHRECQYHPGQAEIDFSGDFWADDDFYNGEPDFEGCQDYERGGFTWTCCGENGETEYCKTGRHRPQGYSHWNGLRFAVDAKQDDSDTATDSDTDPGTESEGENESGSEDLEEEP